VSITNTGVWSTVNDCCTWVAALKFEFPGWLASSTHVPAAWKLTTPDPLIEHTDVAEEPTVMTAGSCWASSRPSPAAPPTAQVRPARRPLRQLSA
jgi:hypothetical protein